MEKPDIYRLFVASQETESSWPPSLSEAHTAFILAFIEAEQAKEEAAIDQFLAARER